MDKKFPEIIYVPHDTHFDLHTQRVSWEQDGVERSIKLQPDKTYVRPSEDTRSAWRNRPAWAGNGGSSGRWPRARSAISPARFPAAEKSEISKPITDAVLTGPVFVADLKHDFDRVSELIDYNYSDRFLDRTKVDQRPRAGAGTFARFGHQTAHT